MKQLKLTLTKNNTKRLKELVRLYRKTCPDYNLSFTAQANLLLGGRLTVAFHEAEQEFKRQ